MHACKQVLDMSRKRDGSTVEGRGLLALEISSDPRSAELRRVLHWFWAPCSSFHS